ncbi:TetR/AcrR family transcriptional regulator [Micromonospora sp. RTGN7]|uniref:TetR/AcrR family transcriptional regulator n=1 Tax=Micromonospora sp. RTGN7 TaxID=3016526 RepID=UPI0029FF18EB|nr:TetR/AcrR family transcriptional regulator [Micromonospora sp. RTGN7]
MPRITEEYRASRRAEIVSAAARRFAEDGFHNTSMADLIAESGMSAGAVYRYFRSKEEIIGAVAETALTTAEEVFERLLADGATPSPAETVTALVEGAITKLARNAIEGVDTTRIAVQVWGEALRNPEIAERTGSVYQRLRGHCAEVARRWQAAGNLPADAVPDQVGAAMLALGQGFLLQNLLIADTSAPAYLDGVRALLGGDLPARVELHLPAAAEPS